MRKLICKPLLWLLVVGIAVISFSQPTLSAENEIDPNAVKTAENEIDPNAVKTAENEIHPNAVDNIYFDIFERRGKITGYVIFTDKDANQCATSGRLTLRREYKDKITGYGKDNKPIYSYKQEFIRHKEFGAKDFKDMPALDGIEVYALPLQFNKRDVKVEDVVILEWNTFKVEKEIWGE